MKNWKHIVDLGCNIYGYTDWFGTKLAFLENAYLENVPYGGEIIAAYVVHAINADDENDKKVYLCIWPDNKPETDKYGNCPTEPSDYINWWVCNDVKDTADNWDDWAAEL